MKRFAALSAVAGALTTAGILAALVLAPTAAAYSPEQLPSLGYSVSVLTLTDGVCRNWSAGFGNAVKTDLGSDCDPGFQQRLDDFVKATCPCAQPATTTPATSHHHHHDDAGTGTATCYDHNHCDHHRDDAPACCTGRRFHRNGRRSERSHLR